MYNSISLFIGAIVSIMIMINGTLSAMAGNYTASVIIHIVGLIPVIIAMLVKRSGLRANKGIPIFLYSAGAIGVFTVVSSNMTYPVLGVSLPLAAGLFGQLLASLAFDHFELLNMPKLKFEKKKFIGMAIIISGIVVMAIL